MENLIEKIYGLKNEHLVTPLNLMNNAKLENYEYVKYYTQNNYFIAEMKCEMYKKMHLFYYYFKNDKLEKIILDDGGKEELVFSREEELEKILKDYSQGKLARVV